MKQKMLIMSNDDLVVDSPGFLNKYTIKFSDLYPK